MKTETSERLKKFAFYCLAGYFFSTTFSHALAQMFFGLALIFGIISWVGRRGDGVKGEGRWFYLMVALFVGWSILSALLGSTPLKSILILKEEWLFLMIPVAAWAIDRESRVKAALYIVAASAILVSLYGIIQHFTGMDLYHGGTLTTAPSSGYRISGLFSHRLTFGNYFAVLAIFFLGVAPFFKSRQEKMLLYGAFFLSSIATALTYSRGPIVVVATGIILSLLIPGRRHIKALGTLLVGMIVTLLIVSPDLLSRYSSSAATEWEGTYAGSRQSIWRTAGRMIGDHPLLGVGQGNFEELYEKYRDPDSDRRYGHAHNDILNVAAYAGIPAALFFVGFWGVMMVGMVRALRRFSGADLGRGIITGALLASLVFFLTSLYEATFADEEVRLLLMVIWGLYLGVANRLKATGQMADITEKA